MISRVAVLPHPPLLVPELVGGGDREADAVRAACLDVARDLADASSHWTAVGVGHGVTAGTGTFRGYGADVRVSLDGTAGEPTSWPLPALIAAWLRDQAGAECVDMRLVAPDLDPTSCVALGRELDGALLVLGDGSHRHGDRAVGRPDDRAGPFDEHVARALADVDLDAILAIDPDQAEQLGAAGRAAWQVLAGAIGADGRPWRAVRTSTLVPFGVAYHLAVWEPA